MKGNKLVDSSTDFAAKMMKVCDKIKEHYSTVNQPERSGTSICADIREANYAHSKNDFIAKLQTALQKGQNSICAFTCFLTPSYPPLQDYQAVFRPLQTLTRDTDNPTNAPLCYISARSPYADIWGPSE